ncbi:MAG TPA: hypothetical protein VF610_03475 [Segetibacter sp.]|jgi:hypothetical protein
MAIVQISLFTPFYLMHIPANDALVFSHNMQGSKHQYLQEKPN